MAIKGFRISTGASLFHSEWRLMNRFLRARAWKNTLLGIFLLFAGEMALANVPQVHDWTREKVAAKSENALGGSFMSVDPVLTDNNTGDSFNRYNYANNNPYRYTDPDGRFSTQDCRDLVGNCTTVGDAGVRRNEAVATGAKLGFAAGVAVAGGCTLTTAGTCAIGGLAIVATGTFLGGAAGGVVQDLAEKFGGKSSATPPPDGDDDKKKESPATQPALKRIHSNDTLKNSNKSSYDYLNKMSTKDIVKSLQPGQEESLIVKPDGRVFQGNMRTMILEERGVNINSLPRTIIK
jgi:hypothetical protein